MDCCSISSGALIFFVGLEAIISSVWFIQPLLAPAGMLIAVLGALIVPFQCCGDEEGRANGQTGLRLASVHRRIARHSFPCGKCTVDRPVMSYLLLVILVFALILCMLVSASVRANHDLVTQNLSLSLVILTTALVLARLRRMALGRVQVACTLDSVALAAAKEQATNLAAAFERVANPEDAGEGESSPRRDRGGGGGPAPQMAFRPGRVAAATRGAAAAAAAGDDGDEEERGAALRPADGRGIAAVNWATTSQRDLRGPSAAAQSERAHVVAERLLYIASKGPGASSTAIIATALGVFCLVLFLTILTLAHSVTADITRCSVAGHSALRMPSVDPYPACGERFLSNRIGLTDAACMANLAYMTRGEAFNSTLQAWFSSSEGWAAVHSSDDVGDVFFHAIERDPKPGAPASWINPGPDTWPAAELPVDGCPNCTLLVLAVRGTTTGIDAVKDIDVWLEAALTQGTINQLPGFSMTANNVTAKWVDVMSHLSLVTERRLDAYWKPVVDYVYDRYPSARPENGGTINGHPLRQSVLVVGHSLGGGLAKIIAAKLGVRAVSFSGPGLGLTRAKFNIEERDLDKTGLNIVPEEDPVPMVDNQRGSTQRILCDSQLTGCHSLDRTSMVLIRNCGDPEGRSVVRPHEESCKVNPVNAWH